MSNPSAMPILDERDGPKKQKLGLALPLGLALGKNEGRFDEPKPTLYFSTSTHNTTCWLRLFPRLRDALWVCVGASWTLSRLAGVLTRYFFPYGNFLSSLVPFFVHYCQLFNCFVFLCFQFHNEWHYERIREDVPEPCWQAAEALW